MAPQILALDEPTSNLDPVHRRRLIGLLKKFACTKIIATHDLEFVIEICDRVALLDGGTIIAEGEVIPILSDKTLLEAMAWRSRTACAKTRMSTQPFLQK